MREETNQYFKEALSDFAYDMACGAQIRHLADLEHTVRQICDELDVSAPYQRVQKTVNEHLHKMGVLLSGKPDCTTLAKTTFVREYDSYGRASFRQVVLKDTKTPVVCWQEYIYQPASDGNLLDFLTKKIEINGETVSYISCDFGRDRQIMEKSLKALERRQQEYMKDILWKKTRMYHRLTPRMKEIIFCLYEQGLYNGEGFFQKTCEHIIFP